MDHGAGFENVSQRILSIYLQRLKDDGSELLRDDEATEQLRLQVESIVGDVLHRLGLPLAAPEAGLATDVLASVEIGSRPAARVHPFESLRAASALFEIGMEVLAELLPFGDANAISALGLALQDAVMRRMAVASISYVDLLRSKLQESWQEERRRIARELHDRVGHGIGVALQNIELHRNYVRGAATVGSERDRLTNAVGSLRESLRTVQQISTELRHSMSTDGIEADLRSYLSMAVPSSIRVHTLISAGARKLRRDIGEELFLILREAIRNAVRHADPTELWIEVEVTDTELRASVRDNGCGFTARPVVDPSHIGLSSMSERAELLNGALRIDSGAAGGTTVTVRAPWTRMRLK